MPLQTEGVVLRNQRIQSSYFLLDIDCPPISRIIKPGQFVMVKVSQTLDPILRRPFSLFKNHPVSNGGKKKGGVFSILYKTVGKGTLRMTEMREGETIDLIGPLGNGFSLQTLSTKKVILIGGGVGIAPLLPLAEALRGEKELFVFIGGKTNDDVLCTKDFQLLGSTIHIATENGTMGYRGTVIDLFLSMRDKIWAEGPCSIYSSGPSEMLRALAKVLGPNKKLCEGSFEARMACGFGACWGCVIKTRDPTSPYQRVCKEGPVFNLGIITWKDQ